MFCPTHFIRGQNLDQHYQILPNYLFIKFEEKIPAYPFIRVSSFIKDLRVQQRKQIRADLYTLLYLLQLKM